MSHFRRVYSRLQVQGGLSITDLTVNLMLSSLNSPEERSRLISSVLTDMRKTLTRKF